MASKEVPDFVALVSELSPELISSATESQLLIILPLILNNINTAHAANQISDLTTSLSNRLHTSRRLKLRCLLLRHHPVFKSILFKLRYSSTAYQQPNTNQADPFIGRRTACSASFLELSLEEDAAHFSPLMIKVDMVDLQSEDYYCKVIFSSSNLKDDNQIGQQFITHVFQPHSDDRTPDEVCLPSSEHDTFSDEEYYTDEEDNEVVSAQLSGNESEMGQARTFVQFGFRIQKARYNSFLPNQIQTYPPQSNYSSRRNETLSNNTGSSTISHSDTLIDLRYLSEENANDEIRKERLTSMLPSLHVRSNFDGMKFHAITFTFQLMNEIWKKPLSSDFVDPLCAPFCVTLDSTAISEDKGIVQAILHESPLNTVNFNNDGDSVNLTPVDIDQLIRSSAGAYTAGYILGLTTKTNKEISIKDGNTLVWKSFSGVFGNTNDGSNSNSLIMGWKLVIPRHFKNYLKEVQALDSFRKCCSSAFQAMRSCWVSTIEPIVGPLFASCGCPRRQLERYVHGRLGLNGSETDQTVAQQTFRKWIS